MFTVRATSVGDEIDRELWAMADKPYYLSLRATRILVAVVVAVGAAVAVVLAVQAHPLAALLVAVTSPAAAVAAVLAVEGAQNRLTRD
jgi:hypothetical protein